MTVLPIILYLVIEPSWREEREKSSPSLSLSSARAPIDKHVSAEPRRRSEHSSKELRYCYLELLHRPEPLHYQVLPCLTQCCGSRIRDPRPGIRIKLISDPMSWVNRTQDLDPQHALTPTPYNLE
jgi:hypothetical protein